MQVLKSNVLIVQDEPTNMRGSLYVPSGKEEWPPYGIVKAVGKDVKNVVVGDRVIFKRKPDSAVDVYARPGDQYYGHLVLPEDFILAVIDGN